MSTVLRGERKGRSGSISSNGSKAVYEERRTFVVVSSELNDSVLNVLATSGLPVVMLTTISGTYGYCICTRLDPKQSEEDPHVWFVEATYTTDIEGQDTGGTPGDPLTWVPKYKGKFEYYPEPLYQDFTTPDAKPYVNGAGDKFPEPLLIRRPIVVYEFWQIEANTVTDLEIGQRCDIINSTAFRTVFAARTLKVQVSGFERGWFYGIEGVKIDYQAAYKESTWIHKPMNAGYGYRLTAGGQKIASDTLVFLNSDGTKKPDSTTTPDYLEFKAFKEVDVNAFLR